MKGRVLHRLDARSGTDEQLHRFPAPDVYASASSSWVAYLSPGRRSTEANPDFLLQPGLRLLHLRSRARRNLGSGLAPQWHPSSTAVAYLRPSGKRVCDGETCVGHLEVVVADPAAQATRSVLGPGAWSLLGWAGEALLVADGRDPSHTLVVAMDGERASLRVAPSEIWGVSPDGRWLLTAAPGAASFVRLEGGRMTGREVPVPLGGRVLSLGSWSFDSKQVAAVTHRRAAAPSGDGALR